VAPVAGSSFLTVSGNGTIDSGTATFNAGNGTLRFLGASQNLTGTTNLDGGTVIVDQASSIISKQTLTVNTAHLVADGSLELSGAGNLVVQNTTGGLLLEGNANLSLDVSGNIQFTAGANSTMEVAGNYTLLLANSGKTFVDIAGTGGALV